MRPTATAALEAVFTDLDLEFVVQPARDLTAVTPLHWIVWALEAEQCGGFGAVGEQHDFLEHLACVDRVLDHDQTAAVASAVAALLPFGGEHHEAFADAGVGAQNESLLRFPLRAQFLKGRGRLERAGSLTFSRESRAGG